MGRRRPATAGRLPVAVYSPRANPKTRSKSRRAAVGSAPLPDLAARLRLFQRSLRSRLERRDALLEMMRAVNTTLEPAKIAELIVERASTWMPVPCWAVVSAEQSGQLSVLADRGLEADLGTAMYGVAAWVMDRGEVFVTADLGRDGRVPHQSVASVIAFPLVCRGRRVGALIGLDRARSARIPRLAPAILRSVRMLLEPAAVALENALVLKRTEALSVTDDLTRLYNSRFLNLVLRRETKRASRSGSPLSLLFIDLDGFKAVNDKHGHLCGSRALVEAATVIRGSARETDVVARFGGDEFALVLPDTGAEGAYSVGARIRERVAAHHFLANEGLDLRLTVSVGIATLPEAAGSADELMHAADSAMYHVKDRGKNGIQVAGSPVDN
jgi:diguanylate cyclase (GGDEF)-like protein